MDTAAQALGIAASLIAVLTPVFLYERQRRRQLAQLRNEVTERDGRVASLEDKARTQAAEHEQELEQHRDRYDALSAQHRMLARDFGDLRRGESGVLIRYEIDDLLTTLRGTVGAEGASVAVPEPLSRPPGFVYLCAQGPAAPRVAPHRLPLHKGVTGYVFDKGEARLSGDARADEHFFQAMDDVTEHVTASLLTLPLWDAGHNKRIGVVQFVNKTDNTAFTPEERDEMEQRLKELSDKTEQFTKNAENFRIFRQVSDRNSRQDSIMFCDLTASSQLFARFARVETSIAIRCIKEYLESQTRAAFDHGAMVDKYLGDGIMLRFNLSEAGDDETHVTRAVDAAREMMVEFRTLKQSWAEFELDVGSVHNRISIASGLVYEESLGHPQFRQATVIGEPVIRAQDLCDRATRAQDVVLLDEETRKRIGNQVRVTEIRFPNAARPPSRAFAMNLESGPA